MKSDKNILIAFILNLSFSILECLGGIFTNSVAILSDAVHDMGDAVSIGVSYLLEKKSQKQPDDVYTYGYLRYSVLGSIVSTLVLLTGSCLVIVNAISRIRSPQEIRYTGMIILAVIGVAVNLLAAFFTRHGHSMNQKAVNLHMLEDVLGWAVVLVGAVVMRFTDFKLIDPLMSIGVAVYILLHGLSHLKRALDLFLVKIPRGIRVGDVKGHLREIEGVTDVHHMHIWSMDGNLHYATMHVVASGDHETVKKAAREALAEYGITHATLELEKQGEPCDQMCCHVHSHHRHHHGHHH